MDESGGERWWRECAGPYGQHCRLQSEFPGDFAGNDQRTETVLGVVIGGRDSGVPGEGKEPRSLLQPLSRGRVEYSIRRASCWLLPQTLQVTLGGSLPRVLFAIVSAVRQAPRVLRDHYPVTLNDACAVLLRPRYVHCTVAVPPEPLVSSCQFQLATPLPLAVRADPSNDRGARPVE